MLSRVADQQHAVIGAKSGEEFAHLIGARQARFIDEIEMPMSRRGIGLSRTGKEALQSAGFDPSLTELPRGTRSRREALDFVSLHLHGSPYRGQGRGFA